MKRQSVMNRGSAKEGTDLLDIVRLTTDPATAASVIDGLRTADDQLTADALCTHAAGSRQCGPHPATDSRHPEGASTTAEDPRPCRRTPRPRCVARRSADRQINWLLTAAQESCACEIVDSTDSDAVAMDSGTAASSFQRSQRLRQSVQRRRNTGEHGLRRDQASWAACSRLDCASATCWPAHCVGLACCQRSQALVCLVEPLTHRSGERIDCLTGLALNATGRRARRLTGDVEICPSSAPQPVSARAATAIPATIPIFMRLSISGRRSAFTEPPCFSQGNDDPRYAAQITQPEYVLTRGHLAQDFTPVVAQTGSWVDVVDGEHDSALRPRCWPLGDSWSEHVLRWSAARLVGPGDTYRFGRAVSAHRGHHPESASMAISTCTAGRTVACPMLHQRPFAHWAECNAPIVQHHAHSPSSTQPTGRPGVHACPQIRTRSPATSETVVVWGHVPHSVAHR